MAVVQNTYTGNGVTVLYSLSFPYLDRSDVKVSVNGTIVTNYIFATDTSIQFLAAPANGAAIRIYRETDIDEASNTIFAGSSIKASDLNENFTQALYAAQESNFEADSATTTANTALSNSNTALSNSSTALSNSTTAVNTANSAVSTANAASASAATAVSTANTASSNASAAVTTANAASSAASTAVSTANAATSTANTALSNSNTAVSTANTASTNASNAVTTANTAAADAATAISTANSASSTANSALTTANTALNNSNTAVSTANSAILAVANAVTYSPVANLTALAALTPANGDYFELTDSTGAESSALITGVTVGLVGAPGLTFRLRYDSPPGIFTFLGYFANDSETRYLKLAGGTLTGQLLGDDSTSASTPGFAFDGDPNTGVGRPGADELALITGGTARLTIDAAGNISAPGNISGGSLIPSASTAPSNGLYLPSANSVAISTNNAGRLFIDSSGRVGLGTSSPNARVDVTDGGLQLTDTSSSFAASESLSYYHNTSTQYAEIQFKPQNASQGYIYFKNRVGSALTDVLTIQGSNVGIGTTSPAHLLSVSQATGDAQIHIGSPDSSGANSRAAVIQKTATGGGDSGCRFYFSNHPTSNLGYLAFNSSQATECARIDSSGRLGLGTSAPSEQFHVANADDAVVLIESTGTDSTDDARLELKTTNGTFSIQNDRSLGTSGVLTFAGNTSNNLCIDHSTGRVGIGTTSPATPLHVAGNVTVSSGSGIYLGFGSEQYITSSGASTNNTSLVFQRWTGAAYGESARIDSSGRLLVGTSTARSNFFNTPGTYSGLLNIESTGNASRVCSIVQNSANTQDPVFVLAKSRGVAAGSYALVSNGDPVGTLAFQGADGSELIQLAAIAAYVDGTPGSNRMPGKLTFSTATDAAPSVLTERMRITNNGSIFTVVPGGSTVYQAFSARAWVNFNGTGTVAIRASGNVTSITDNNVGDYTVNLSTAMPDANYAITGTASRASTAFGQASSGYTLTPNDIQTARTSSAFRIAILANAGDGNYDGLVDSSQVNVSIFR